MSLEHPGRRWILTGVLLMVLAILVFAAGVYRSISSFDMTPVLMPGEVLITMDEPGSLDIAYEPDSIIDGVEIASPSEPAMILSLIAVEDGRSVELESPVVAATYSLGGRRGRVIGSASLSAGSWKLIGEAPEDQGKSAVYAYGQSGLVSVFMPVIVAAFIAVLLAPAGVGCLVVGIVVRTRRRKALEASLEG